MVWITRWRATEDAAREGAVKLPVFGIIREKAPSLALLNKASLLPRFNADISGRLNSYNYVYPSFNVINKGRITLDANGQHRSLAEIPGKAD